MITAFFKLIKTFCFINLIYWES